MSSATLTSLAMLKVHIDQGMDYLEYLRPFVLEILSRHAPSPITDAVVRDHIRMDFGLEIPERTVHIVLGRLSQKNLLTREQGVYHIPKELPNPGIGAKKAEAKRHIDAVVTELKTFSEDTPRPISSDEEAVDAICAFLAELNIPCLRAYLQGTAIPAIQNHDNALVVLVSRYVLSIQKKSPERFESFLVMVKGHMLANALLCPDLDQAPKSYNHVTFYLDTPLLVQRLGLEGDAKKAAVRDLISLLQFLGATIAAFSHSRDELYRVIDGASNYIESSNGRGEIVIEARKTGTTKSDLLLIAGQIDEKLKANGIEIKRTPRYESDFQIDEKVFEDVLKKEKLLYRNPRAGEDDINSVRSIYALRSGTSPKLLEHAKAVLVTSNIAFAKAAFKYGQDHETSQDVSSVITDFSLANMAWLKAPLEAPNLPMTEVIAFSYAALQPSNVLLDKLLKEIDKLQKQGEITESDHQVLRSSPIVPEKLMNLTLGEEAALTSETVTETLRRVVSEIKKEEDAKYQAEQAEHRKTRDALESEREKNRAHESRFRRRCNRMAGIGAGAVSCVLVALLSFGLLAPGLGLTSAHPILGYVLSIGAGLLLVATIGNLFVGVTVVGLHRRMKNWLADWFWKRRQHG